MTITQKLLDWFDAHRRTHLPWREDPTPYHVWVSEIMLQQTRVETVLPYYERFMARLPDLQDLAEVDEDSLLKLWQGLGYYSRAKNLKKAARVMVEDHGGRIPRNWEDLTALPGIGPYTAGAILSIAFQEPYLAPDGNLYRIGARMTMEEEEIEKSSSKRRVEDFLKSFLSEDRPGDFNQALMDLGSGICLAKGQPLCCLCPLQEGCLAFREGRQSEFPRRKEKKKRREEEKTLLLIRRGEDVLLVRRPQKGLLGGLWSLPMLAGHWDEKEVLAWMEERMGQTSSSYSVRYNGSYRHIFSHVEWDMICYLLEDCEPNRFLVGEKDGAFLAFSSDGEGLEAFDEAVWADPEDLAHEYSIPSAFLPFFTEAEVDES
ncbi:A/G-specific adenine glycosylase [Kallipyga massiliensis]|uniref:A/G-specific adenine glycosylase n=1 Tax=Kallipyga massiliensis TaxID=1472764 RepID=UPI0004BBA6C8|nr:A/G-specific adenine glycosylase [Kallipyga massiliensis]